jgi:hypothetical protein
MYNCVFSFANNYIDFKSLITNKIDFIFTDKQYDKNCISLNKKVNLYDCFVYLNNENQNYKYYLFFSSKGYLKQKTINLFDNNELYLNYYRDYVYFLKYDYFLCKLFRLYENNLDDFVFLNFLSDYFSSFNHNINKSLFDKFVFPKNKFVYNAFVVGRQNEKFKYKKN